MPQLNLFPQGQDLPLFAGVKPLFGSHGEPIEPTPLPDRTDELREIAITILSSSDDEWWPLDERVDYYCDQFAADLPDWFQQSHRDELTDIAAQMY